MACPQNIDVIVMGKVQSHTNCAFELVRVDCRAEPH